MRLGESKGKAFLFSLTEQLFLQGSFLVLVVHISNNPCFFFFFLGFMNYLAILVLWKEESSFGYKEAPLMASCLLL